MWLLCCRLVSFLHASEQYQLALPLVGLAVEWQWRMKVGEIRREVMFVDCGVLLSDLLVLLVLLRLLVMLLVNIDVVMVCARLLLLKIVLVITSTCCVLVLLSRCMLSLTMFNLLHSYCTCLGIGRGVRRCGISTT